MSVLHQGRHATKDEITACAFQAVNIDNKYNGAPVQVRVVMGKEPRHFLAIFKGKLVIFEVRLFLFLLLDYRSSNVKKVYILLVCAIVVEGQKNYYCNTIRKRFISPGENITKTLILH